jgi:tripartite-type tricarboxylate transporter receptor subunit TctC
MVPKATPAAIVKELEVAISETLKRPEVQERMRASALDVQGLSASDTQTHLKTEMPRWAAIVKRVNLSLD